MFSVGEIIDKEMVRKSGFGMESKRYVDERKLIPDEMIAEVVIKRLLTNNNKGNMHHNEATR